MAAKSLAQVCRHREEQGNFLHAEVKTPVLYVWIKL
jgi:hypothetical protein